MSDIDIETGLPKLPENFFWRVSNSGGIIDVYPMVEIREKYVGFFGREKSRRAGIGDTLVSHTWGPRDGESVRENILYLAEKIVNRFEDQRTQLSEPDYRGDYPPKSL